MSNGAIWRLRNRCVPIEQRTLIMGILNVTPDSFSDGGMWLAPHVAIEHGCSILDQGADFIDVGGESTRPGAAPLDPVEEQGRVLPVIRGLLRHRPDAILSVDTYHAETARLALDSGAEIVNDVSGGLWDEAMRPVWAQTGCGVVVMHTRGRPQEWSTQPPLPSGDIVGLVVRDLRDRVHEALTAGVARDSIAVDPGFGFGKRGDENFPLLAGLKEVCMLGSPVVAGLSRKGFLRRTIEISEERTGWSRLHSGEALRDATLAANTAAVLGGAHILRVHDVAAARRAVAIADRVVEAGR